MADNCDIAQDYIERDMEKRIAAARGNLNTAAESLTDCIECGAEIPTARQIALPGCTMCVQCASIYEG